MKYTFDGKKKEKKLVQKSDLNKNINENISNKRRNKNISNKKATLKAK